MFPMKKRKKSEKNYSVTLTTTFSFGKRDNDNVPFPFFLLSMERWNVDFYLNKKFNHKNWHVTLRLRIPFSIQKIYCSCRSCGSIHKLVDRPFLQIIPTHPALFKCFFFFRTEVYVMACRCRRLHFTFNSNFIMRNRKFERTQYDWIVCLK